ncbi:hypothetical protein PAF15_02290 [Weissella koreensis]|uniref:YciI family protein n=1 Tax=Weissella koreensis TaxID=165096 RepID=UPI0022BA4217|nr:hypothetical protein [Weissella koreensis]MCZ9310804.1 hypothetical protein [Weissella koreensis]
MYLINVEILEDSKAVKANEHLMEHQNWFNRHFEEGDFLLIGPSKTYQRAGVILAQAKNLESLQQIISEDIYYPNLANYEINEFSALKISEKILNDEQQEENK